LPPPLSTLFPYTTLFRSFRARRHQRIPVDGRALSPLNVLRRPLFFDTSFDANDGRSLYQLEVRAIDRQRNAVPGAAGDRTALPRSEEHTSELQSLTKLVC